MSHLWVLEDDAELRWAMMALSRQAGLTPLGLSSLAEAEQAVRLVAAGAAPAPAFIISDFHLPDGTSLAWLLAIGRRWAGTRILCASGHLPEDAALALTVAGIACVAKPLDVQQLLQSWTYP